MPTKVLTDDLANCLIDFDEKISISNLQSEYGGDLREISEQLQNAVAAEEKNGKEFCKWFMVSGEIDDAGNQIVTLVPEEKLARWQKKLRQATSLLYCVETVGSAKCPWPPLKPVQHRRLELENVRRPEKKAVVAAVAAPAAKTVKAPVVVKTEQKAPVAVASTAPKKTSPDVKKLAGKQQTTTKKAEPTKKATDFFKKQDKPTPIPPKKTPEKKKPAPEAVQASPSVFADDSSSDEEETLKALKRDVLSDDEPPADNPTVKRRRIADSDDEEEEKKPEPIEVDEDSNPAEISTFQDEDGFMITVKDKVKKPSAAPVAKKVSPPKPAKAVAANKKDAKPAAKTKQGSIMNFFSKK